MSWKGKKKAKVTAIRLCQAPHVRSRVNFPLYKTRQELRAGARRCTTKESSRFRTRAEGDEEIADVDPWCTFR